jgi:o-succinylbenzoate synthase
MKITDIQLGYLSVPLKTPFKTALRTVTHVDDVLVKIHTDTGVLGYGSAAPTAEITGDTRAKITEAIEGPIKEQLIGRSIEPFEEIMMGLDASLPDNTSPKAAVDIALYDLLGKLHKVPVYNLLGGCQRKLTTDITISVNEPEEMVRDSLEAVNQRFTILKLKVGTNPEKDIKRLQQVWEAAGPRIQLRLDANQGWTPQESVYVLQKIEEAGILIEFVEQPVTGKDLEGLKFVKDHISFPVVADESAFSPEDVLKIIRMDAADIINIKLMKTGGIHNALKICDMAEHSGIECMIGCMLESKISVTAAAHLAAAKQVITRCDLDAPLLCREDPIVGGIEYSGDCITLSDQPGFGFTVIRE